MAENPDDNWQVQDEYDPDENREYYATLNDAAYTYGNAQLAGKTQEEARDAAHKGLRDYGYEDQIDMPLSDTGEVGTVFTGGHKGSGKTLVYKGSSNRHDILPDVEIGLGNVQSDNVLNRFKKSALALFGRKDRFDRADDLFDATTAKHGKDIALSGHSLGGFLAVKKGREAGIKSYTYNPALVDYFGYGQEGKHRADCGPGGEKCKNEAAQEVWTTGKDIVSAQGRYLGGGIGDKKDIIHNEWSDYLDPSDSRSSPDDIKYLVQHGLGYFLPDKKSNIPSHHNKLMDLPNGHQHHNLGGHMIKSIAQKGVDAAGKKIVESIKWRYPHYFKY